MQELFIFSQSSEDILHAQYTTTAGKYLKTHTRISGWQTNWS